MALLKSNLNDTVLSTLCIILNELLWDVMQIKSYQPYVNNKKYLEYLISDL
jgi:hypothetical protein